MCCKQEMRNLQGIKVKARSLHCHTVFRFSLFELKQNLFRSAGVSTFRMPSSSGCALRRHPYYKWSRNFSEPAWPRTTSSTRTYTTDHLLLKQSGFMIAARPTCSVKRVLYQNASQAELQWKMEEYNRLWGDCKVRGDCLLQSCCLYICVMCNKWCFFCRKRLNKRRDYCSNSNTSLKKTRKLRYTGQVQLRDSLLKWTTKTFIVAVDSAEPQVSYFSSLLDVCTKFEYPSDK